MANTEDPIKGFHIYSRSHYSRAGHPQEIMIGRYYPTGGCEAEFAIRWHDLGARPGRVPRLEVYNDAWRMFFEMEEMRGLAGLTGTNATEQQIVDFLLAAGFKDLTKYEAPKPLNPFSVLLLYPEGDNEGGTETYLARVHAADKNQAVMDAREEAVRSNEWSEDRENDFAVLLVAEGHIADLGEAS